MGVMKKLLIILLFIIIIILILFKIKTPDNLPEKIVIKNVITIPLKLENNLPLLYPKISHNNQYIIYTTATKDGLYLYEIKTNQSKKIISEKLADTFYDWSMDDNFIAYTTYIEKEDGLFYYVIKVYDLSANKNEDINEPCREITKPTWLVKSKNEMLLYFFADNILKEKIYNAKSKLDYNKKNEERIVFQKDMNIWSQKLDKTDVRRLSLNGGYNPILSPDKQKVLFQNGDEIFYTFVTGETEAIKIGIGLEAIWTKDSNKIVFIKTEDDGHDITASDIFYYDINTKKIEQLTNTKDKIELHPYLSADNKELYYVDYETNQLEKFELKL